MLNLVACLGFIMHENLVMLIDYVIHLKMQLTTGSHVLCKLFLA